MLEPEPTTNPKRIRFRHRRVTDADYRIFQNSKTRLWLVAEYYKDERTVVADRDIPTKDEAIELARRLADRDEF